MASTTGTARWITAEHFHFTSPIDKNNLSTVLLTQWFHCPSVGRQAPGLIHDRVKPKTSIVNVIITNGLTKMTKAVKHHKNQKQQNNLCTHEYEVNIRINKYSMVIGVMRKIPLPNRSFPQLQSPPQLVSSILPLLISSTGLSRPFFHQYDEY